MAHEMETMAYTGERPWHRLGFAVNNDMTPEQMMVASGTDWDVFKSPLYAHMENGEQVLVKDQMALLRDKDNSVLDIVGGDAWHFTQNREAFDFFKEFVEVGKMQMETAGSLQNGKIVWVLAKIKESFELFGGDMVQGYLLFSNFHKYGFSRDIRFTPIRVVCNNTLTMALTGKTDKVFRASHRVKITNDLVKEALGLVHKQMNEYSEVAEFLGSVEYKDEEVIKFFSEVFPTNSVKREVSRNAEKAMNALTYQPGVEFAPNSWWQAFNAVTYVTDHEMGRSEENRVENMWYGTVKDLKVKAITLARSFAQGKVTV